MNDRLPFTDTTFPPVRWRLGLDLGANSLGFAALRLDDRGCPIEIMRIGSRIFPDGRYPKSRASLAAGRRLARSTRHRQDRLKQRRDALLKYLVHYGLFPATEQERLALRKLDPYEIRARAIGTCLHPHQIGRALIHINRRRGFQSNRKTDRGKDDEAGKVATGIDRLQAAITESGAQTLGAFQHMRRASAEDANHIPSVRTRLRAATEPGEKGAVYDFYPSRALLKLEFEAIWKTQAVFHPTILTDAARRSLFEIIFSQRKLKAPVVGFCTLVAGEKRLPKAHPLFQKRRLLEEVNALTIRHLGLADERLTQEQQFLILQTLQGRQKVRFAALRKKLKLDKSARFSKESAHKTDLMGDPVAAAMSNRTRFGIGWFHLSDERQSDVIERLSSLETAEDEVAFQEWLVQTFDMSDVQARAVCTASLPEGYGHLGLTATRALVDVLSKQTNDSGRVLVYSEAVSRAGLGHHSDLRAGEVFTDNRGRPCLPYYGIPLERYLTPGTGVPGDPDDIRYGRLTNPTVHIGLNQLRRVVNGLIREFGKPTEIALEILRELKLSEDERSELRRTNAKNEIEARRRDALLQKLGQPMTGANRTLLKLWEELNPDDVLDRRCIYTGEMISCAMLFDGRVEVDHILPLSMTLDDSGANKLLCLREANRDKQRMSPFERWGMSERWDDIRERATKLPKNKQWRFQPDAMEEARDNPDFLARHLVDTQYLARRAREYLSTLYPERGEGSSHVWTSPGRLTAIVRRKLGLNTLLDSGTAETPIKNRDDHRHHAIDAVVTAILDRSMLQEMARLSALEGESGRERIQVAAPWPEFQEDLAHALQRMVVSHRPDHGTVTRSGRFTGRDSTAGRLHNDTAYGLNVLPDSRGNPRVVHRIPIQEIKNKNKMGAIRDPDLRDALLAFTKGCTGAELARRINEFPNLGPLTYRNIRRVRIVEPWTVISIRDRDGRAYKGYKGDSNYCFEVWRLPDGNWKVEIVSMYDAHQLSVPKRPHPAACKVLKLHKDDILAIERVPGQAELARVVKFSNGTLVLAPPHEGGPLKARHADRQDPFKYISASATSLQNWRARQVRVDETGRVFDAGFRHGGMNMG